MRCTAAMILCLALGALLCAEAYAQVAPLDLRALPFDPMSRVPIVRDTEAHRKALRESAADIRELIARKLRGEEVCSEKLEED